MAAKRAVLPLTSICKVFTSRSSPNYLVPWQNKLPSEGSGSGFAVRDLDGNPRLLTNAHVIADYTRLMVRRHGTADKFPARCVAIGHECDLALLEVPDANFWPGVEPLEFGPVPELRDRVTVVGFPGGHDGLSVTTGVVSRVDTVQYVHAAFNLLAVQIDAGINPGNSGGPAFDASGNIAGVAFQNVPDAQSVGYLIPAPIVRHFLEDFKRHGRYVGFCKLGVRLQALENVALRAHLGMRPDQSGVVINHVLPVCAATGVLQKRDVVMAVDGVPIANDGTIEWRAGERVYFDYLVTTKSVGDLISLRVLRAGVETELVVVAATQQLLVPIHQYGELPEYYMYAGLVFSPLVQPMLHDWGSNDWYNHAPRRLVEQALHGTLDKLGRQVVILSQVLQDEANAGYEGFHGLMVDKVDGHSVDNMAHLAALVRSSEGPYVTLELEDARFVVLNTSTAAEATARIQARHRIAHASWLRAENGRGGGTAEGTLNHEPLTMPSS
ncbi:trypsin-like cysteine/serine peptidase domain-containing protein [Pavlovales sp. CCMP2436]|nr:trypsin-like cysteine/serine peptidase domain-containing protein [Pavlovales sp. CCMP2436]|mmetsp:Transcript_19480/g.49509  ORF Transcript_19480/g.49509 Transcript_19480/m.49509 type:complete len:497 (+) Transcript_19480:60-1550(+)